MGKMAGKHFKLGVRGLVEEPSWGETRWSGTGVATLDRSPDQSPGGKSHIPTSQGTKGNQVGGPPGWRADQVAPLSKLAFLQT